MANPYHHAVSSAKKWGGEPEDYLEIHSWFDASKENWADFRHRALRHHSQGIFECERQFGHAIRISGKRPLRLFERFVSFVSGKKIKTGRKIPVRWIGEQHVKEDCGYIPSMQDWFRHIQPKRWMGQPPVRLEKALENVESSKDWETHVGQKIDVAI